MRETDGGGGLLLHERGETDPDHVLAGAGAVAGVASGLASALGMVRDGKAQRERERDRETLRYELSMASGWGRQARRRRADIQAKLDALGD